MVLPGFGASPIETNVALDTVRVTAADVRLPNVASMLDEPVATAVATPEVDIVAVVVLDDTHDADDVTFWTLPSEYCAVAVNCSVVPAGIVALGGVTVRPVSVADPTMRTLVPVTVPLVAVMVTVPAATGYASPTAMVAFVASDVDQATWLEMSREVPSENAPLAAN